MFFPYADSLDGADLASLVIRYDEAQHVLLSQTRTSLLGILNGIATLC